MTTEIARIYVNNIEVGALPASQYESIVSDARNDRRIYLRQVLNVLGVLFRFLVTSFEYIPQAWFGMLVAIVIGDSISPGFGAGLITEIEKLFKVGQVGLLDAVRMALFWGYTFALTGSLFAMAFGRMTFGAVNEFDSSINRRIREILEVPSEGQMTVVVEKHVLTQAE